MVNTAKSQASIGNNQTMNSDAARYWNALVARIKREKNITILPTEGTRTWERQNYLYQNRNKPGFNPAWPPNSPYAYHMSGRAVDVGSNVGFVNTNEARVFRSLAGAFGFKETVVGEPWHFEWRPEWATVNINQEEENNMALTDADIGKLLNFPAWTGGPSVSQALKTANEVSELIKKQTAEVKIIRDPFAQPTSPAANKHISKVQDDADTNTIVRMLAKKEGLLPS